MKPHDTQQLAALARRLDLAPRRLFALAGRIAASGRPLDAAWLYEEIERVRVAGAGAAELSMLPFAAYAIDDLDRALALALEPPATES